MHSTLAIVLIAWKGLKTLRHLGGLGLILMGLIDSSIIPVPGSMDALTIVLAARDKEPWPYYAVMATIGSVLGGYLTYRLARKGEEKALAKRLPKRAMEQAYRFFEKWGFGSIMVPAMLPPPMPMVPFIVAAGALNYPLKRFLAALTLGRAVRFTVLAYLASIYGRHILRFFKKHYVTLVIVLVALVVVVAAGILIYKVIRKKGARAEDSPVLNYVERR
jgi:membrane protein YqaA with SNARE-associated domain